MRAWGRGRIALDVSVASLIGVTVISWVGVPIGSAADNLRLVLIILAIAGVVFASKFGDGSPLTGYQEYYLLWLFFGLACFFTFYQGFG